MKLLLLFGGIVMSAVTVGQNGPQPYIQKQSTLKVPPPGNNALVQKPELVTPKELQNATYSHSLPNGNKVIQLPQDNMPCIIPSTTGYIPNSGTVLKDKLWPAPIPNAVTANATFVDSLRRN